MSPRDWRARASDVLAAIERIRSYTAGMDLAKFCADERTHSAVLYQLIIIGEAAAALPEEVRKRSDVPWPGVIGLRNVAAHEYFGVDLETVWLTVQNRLGPLEVAVRVLLGTVDSVSGPAVHGHHHLAIQVKDLPKAERFYADVLGLKVTKRWPYEGGKPGERSVWLSVGAGEEFLALEACDAERPPAPFRDPHGGLHLLALRITAAERPQWERKLAELNVEIVHRTRWTLYVRDPEGNRLGLSHFPHEA